MMNLTHEDDGASFTLEMDRADTSDLLHAVTNLDNWLRHERISRDWKSITPTKLEEKVHGLVVMLHDGLTSTAPQQKPVEVEQRSASYGT